MDLRTTYMGRELKNPIMASAGPLQGSLDNIKRMEDAGASAVVLFSLFEEQIRHEAQSLNHFMEFGTDSFAEALSYFPEVNQEYKMHSDRYLELLSRAVREVEIPIFGSLNGVTDEGWTAYAKLMEEAGAHGLELNVYYIAADPHFSGNRVEQQYLDVLTKVKAAVDMPVALKIGPFFSSMANMATRFDEAGADALVLFNRFYQPDFDLENLSVTPDLKLSTPFEIRLPLMWIAILYGRVRASLAATRGVHSAREVVKYLLAGADVVMTTSALLKHGIDYLGKLVRGLDDWMEEREYESVEQMKGAMSHRHVADPSAFERANYIRLLESFEHPYVQQ